MSIRLEKRNIARSRRQQMDICRSWCCSFRPCAIKPYIDLLDTTRRYEGANSLPLGLLLGALSNTVKLVPFGLGLAIVTPSFRLLKTWWKKFRSTFFSLSKSDDGISEELCTYVGRKKEILASCGGCLKVFSIRWVYLFLVSNCHTCSSCVWENQYIIFRGKMQWVMFECKYIYLKKRLDLNLCTNRSYTIWTYAYDIVNSASTRSH